jgi:hypothetical protein
MQKSWKNRKKKENPAFKGHKSVKKEKIMLFFN